ncbi:MAG: hypothetical protein M3373_01320 [Gemmatimonadota bacterium]|nr:hypothetical protein [Gemmatimonadota bacterium]
MAASRARGALLLALLTACSSEPPPPPVIDAERPAPVGAAGPPGPASAEHPIVARDGWEKSEVIKRLTEAGLVVGDPGDTVRHEFLRVPGARLTVGGHDLQVFVYRDTAARAADSRGLDSSTVTPRGGRVDWPTRPHLITSGNLLAILLTPREQLAERVSLALTARHLGIGR